MKNILITGADGFIGRNLRLFLTPRRDLRVLTLRHEDYPQRLEELVSEADFVFHLAGVNRPRDPAEFEIGNARLTRQLCEAVARAGRRTPVLLTSTIHAVRDDAYGRSKRAAERAVLDLERQYQVPTYVVRLPNVFGKWCRPNYNSVVATFCHNIARGLPIQVDDPSAELTLLYVDDLLDVLVHAIGGQTLERDGDGFVRVEPQYATTVGELARVIRGFRDSRRSLMTQPVGAGLMRALYATYVSYLPAESFTYSLPMHTDARGTFVEMLKTDDCGQFSFFTAHPNVTRGGHYHHSKTEKFLVIRGHARFRFRHMITGETYELETSGDTAQVVETVPGWTHDITNIGSEEMVVMLWANEVFDPNRPDTYACPL